MTDENQDDVIPAYPLFEGRTVAGTRTRVKAGTPDATEGIGDVHLSIDDRVLMLSEYRVVDVGFTVDEKTGELIREQVIKPVNMTLHPWNTEDAGDDGVLRAIQ